MTPFAESLGTIDLIKIVTCAVVYNNTITNRSYLLCFPQSLYIPHMESNLLCPMQLQCNGVIVNDVLLQNIPAADWNNKSHSLIVPDDGNLTIPMDLFGVTLYFNVRYPSDCEVSDPDHCSLIYMTSDKTWDPHDSKFQDMELHLRNSLGYSKPAMNQNMYLLDCSASSLDCPDFMEKIRPTIHYHLDCIKIYSVCSEKAERPRECRGISTQMANWS